MVVVVETSAVVEFKKGGVEDTRFGMKLVEFAEKFAAEDAAVESSMGGDVVFRPVDAVVVVLVVASAVEAELGEADVELEGLEAKVEATKLELSKAEVELVTSKAELVELEAEMEETVAEREETEAEEAFDGIMVQFSVIASKPKTQSSAESESPPPHPKDRVSDAFAGTYDTLLLR